MIGVHTNVEFSESSAVAFRSWLERRYGSVEALNEAWGTAFKVVMNVAFMAMAAAVAWARF